MIVPIDCVYMGGTAIEPRVCVIQDGARLHYAVPVALQRAGILSQVFTDWYRNPSSIESALTHIMSLVNPSISARMTQRFHPELDPAKLKSYPSMMWAQVLYRRKFATEIEYFAWMSERFGRWLVRKDISSSNVVFGFVRNLWVDYCLHARSRGIKVVADQIIAPYQFERAEMQRQTERFPGWKTEIERNDNLLIEIEQQTWAATDQITCASQFVRDQLISNGVASEKISVIPYPFDATMITPIDRRNRAGPLVVGFLGKVGLRKGAPYVFELARRFNPDHVRFLMVGPVGIHAEMLEKHRGPAEIIGPVSRASVADWLNRFDVLILPSTCEGSAGAVSEAMAAGLPVITSPNSGSLVRHGVDGFISAYDDVDSMASSIERLLADQQLRHDMGLAGRQSIQSCNLEQYGGALKKLMENALATPQNATRHATQADLQHSTATQSRVAVARPKVCVIQDGARRHYGVPIALQRAGILGRVYTDWYLRARSVESLLTRVMKFINPAMGRRMAERHSSDLDPETVHTRPSLVLGRVVSNKHLTNEIEYFADISSRFARWVLARGFADCNSLFGFVRNVHPSVCRSAKQRGLCVVTDQIIAPFAIEHRESVLQDDRFPDWNTEPKMSSSIGLIEFERETWDSSDRIVCASDYVSRGLIEQGVDQKKIVVIPPPFSSGKFQAMDRRGRSGPLTVGFVGKVGLRKGAPYFLQVAEKCQNLNLKFVMVGPIRLHRSVIERYGNTVQFVGPVARGEVKYWLEKFDMFLFPSTCEGSAGVVSEAMATALPVITSPNSGSLVREGVDGYITAYDDVQAMAEHVRKLAADADLRHQLGVAGRARTEGFTSDQYGQLLEDLFEQLLIQQRNS